MKQDEFRDLLAGYQYTDQRIGGCVKGVGLLEDFLSTTTTAKTLETATADDVPAFAASLVERGLNAWDHLVGPYHYAGMVKNFSLQAGLIHLVDGFEILRNLHRAIGEQLGVDAQAAIFESVELPAMGTMPIEWMRVNAIIFPRLQQAADPEAVKRILRSGLRNLPDEHYLPFKERYEGFSDIDAFLKDRGRRHLENLITHRDNQTPYFNQFIDDDVIEFVRSTPEIGQGVRQGNTIIEIKIPHESIAYLAANDTATKQYHVCHCPVVKESLRHDDLVISAAFCDFCPSFNAKPWEVTFGRKLAYDVLESALRGDLWCRFAIHLPEGTT